MINVRELYDDFVKHINSMTDEELSASLRRAEELSAGCDDWPDDLVEVVRCKDCYMYDRDALMCTNTGAKTHDEFYCADGAK